MARGGARAWELRHAAVTPEAALQKASYCLKDQAGEARPHLGAEARGERGLGGCVGRVAAAAALGLLCGDRCRLGSILGRLHRLQQATRPSRQSQPGCLLLVWFLSASYCSWKCRRAGRGCLTCQDSREVV